MTPSCKCPIDADNFNLGFSNIGPSNTAHSAEFSILLSVLNQTFSHSSLSPMLTDYTKSVPGVTVMPSDSDVDMSLAMFS